MKFTARLLLICGLGFSLAACPPPGSLTSIPAEPEAKLSAADLAGTEWQGVRHIPEPLGMIPREFSGSLSFADGEVTGSTGCNRFSASYAVEDGTLTFGPMAMTKMACRGSAGQFEQRFLALAEGRIGARISPDGKLHLERGIDLFLIYEPAS